MKNQKVDTLRPSTVRPERFDSYSVRPEPVEGRSAQACRRVNPALRGTQDRLSPPYFCLWLTDTHTVTDTLFSYRRAKMKKVLGIIALSILIFLPPTPSMGAGFPEKPVNLVVAYAAGGSTDIIVRAMNEKLAEKMGAPAIVVNKPGSGGLVGAEFVAKSKPDGYTVLVLSLSHLLRQAIDPKMTIDVLKDFEPICLYVTQPLVIVVKGDSKFKSIEEMIDYGLKNPGKLSMGSAGIGATSHFSGELFKAATKVKYKHVPFAGDAPNITALLGGHIDFLVTGLPIVSGKVASGDLRLLASFEEGRLPDIKEVPTLKEKGFPEAIMYSWFSFVVPAGTPKEIVGKLDGFLKSAIKDPNTQTAIRKIGFQEAYKGLEEFPRFVKSEFDRFGKVAKTEGISVK